MSISSEITRLSGNVADALTAIEAKGVTVPSGAKSDDLATLIAAIETGGGGVTRTNIVPEQTVTGSGYLTLTASEVMVAGQNYAYTFDGEERIGTAVAANGNVYVGDVDAFWGNTGGAFATDGWTMYALANVNGEHTVKIDKITF